jgi:mannose-1-phosphate guanylyltransferase
MDTSHVFAVVMAGGSGTRFWPLSRKKTPKQLLGLVDAQKTLLASTLERIKDLVPAERVLIVTGEHLAEPTRAAVPYVPAENILAEPSAKNTAPCVAWAAYHALRRDKDAILAVLAADHFVANEAAYLATMQQALRATRDGSLVTIGIRPSRPETGYGYIEVGRETGESFEVSRFVEKPNLARAQEFLTAGNFLWNSGQFFFRADAIVQAFERHLPEVAALLQGVSTSAPSEEASIVKSAYATVQSISIDNGVMERAERVRVVPGDFGWSDVGSWTTAWELAEKDLLGNAAKGATPVWVDARGNFVHAAPGKIVALIGVEDLVVVDTPDALLVMPRSKAQDVRAVVDALRGLRDDAI